MAEAKNNKKSKAEIYREQRKQRIAKTSKKYSGSRAGRIKAKKIIKRSIVALIIALILLWAGVSIFMSTGAAARASTSYTYGGEKVSAAEFNYFFASSKNNFIQQNQDSLASWGLDTSKPLNTQYVQGTTPQQTWQDWFVSMTEKSVKRVTVLAAEAKKAGFAMTDDEKKSLESMINDQKQYAKDQGKSYGSYLSEIYGKGVNESIVRAAYEKSVLAQDYQTKKSDEINVTDDDINNFYNGKDSSGNPNKDKYDTVYLRMYMFNEAPASASPTDDEKAAATADAQKKAQAFIDGVKDEKSFKDAALKQGVEDAKSQAQKAKDTALKTLEDQKASALASAANDKKQSITADFDKQIADKTKEQDAAIEKAVSDAQTSYGANDGTLMRNITKDSMSNTDITDYVFSADRAAGDKQAISLTSNPGVSVAVYIVQPRALDKNPTQNVRHILAAFDPTNGGQNTTAKSLLSDDEKKLSSSEQLKLEDERAKKKIDDIAAQYNAGEKTEDAFAALATANTDDSGSKDNGGLYENVAVGKMVKEFEDWCFDPARKPGDTGIVKTSYGYHFMYYVKAGEPLYKIDGAVQVRSDKFEAQVNDYYTKYPEKKNNSFFRKLYSYFNKI